MRWFNVQLPATWEHGCGCWCLDGFCIHNTWHKCIHRFIDIDQKRGRKGLAPLSEFLYGICFNRDLYSFLSFVFHLQITILLSWFRLWFCKSWISLSIKRRKVYSVQRHRAPYGTFMSSWNQQINGFKVNSTVLWINSIEIMTISHNDNFSLSFQVKKQQMTKHTSLMLPVQTIKFSIVVCS